MPTKLPVGVAGLGRISADGVGVVVTRSLHKGLPVQITVGGDHV